MNADYLCGEVGNIGLGKKEEWVMRVVTIYSKPGCELCSEAEVVIRQVATRRRFRLEKKNILDDPILVEKYQTAIPVIHVDGQEIARYRLTAFVLESALTR
jgi:glutaredoxin